MNKLKSYYIIIRDGTTHYERAIDRYLKESGRTQGKVAIEKYYICGTQYT